MNCFDWNNRSSDYIDGTLIGAVRKEADEHLDACPACATRFARYRKLLAAIASQPRTPLPVPLRKSPLSFTLPRIDLQIQRSRWERTPWFVRTSVEGLGIAFLILFVIALVPRARLLYERSIERRLDVLNPEELLVAQNDIDKTNPVALVRAKTAPEGTSNPDDFMGEFAGDDEDDVQSHETQPSAGELRVGNAQIWRFIVKTDSPREIRSKVVQALLDLGMKKDTTGIGGIEAPGGIQFDIIVPQHVVNGLKNQLQKLATVTSSGIRKTDANGASDAFTWYKNKSKRPIPAGKTRVVIWLSQI